MKFRKFRGDFMRSEEAIRKELEGKRKVRRNSALSGALEIWGYTDTQIKVLEWVLGERPIC